MITSTGAVLAGLLALTSGTSAQFGLPHGACERLIGEMPASIIGLPSGPVRIASAEMQAARPLSVLERAPTPAARVAPATPNFCRVLGEIGPVDPTAPAIRFQINLPFGWNGKSVQYGGGGFNGVLITGLGLVPGQPYRLPAPLAQGYVTYGTDSGHQLKEGEPPMLFAANDEAFVNFAHASRKKVRDAAKAESLDCVR
jgi:feruloyl esterase